MSSKNHMLKIINNILFIYKIVFGGSIFALVEVMWMIISSCLRQIVFSILLLSVKLSRIFHIQDCHCLLKVGFARSFLEIIGLKFLLCSFA